VPILYPELAQKYGASATYADSPSAHLETEFRFDVLQVAHDHHAQDHFARMPKALADDMLRHFRDRNAAVSFEDDQSKRAKILDEVNQLASTTHR
jgi:hypothetical protein